MIISPFFPGLGNNVAELANVLIIKSFINKSFSAIGSRDKMINSLQRSDAIPRRENLVFAMDQSHSKLLQMIIDVIVGEALPLQLSHLPEVGMWGEVLAFRKAIELADELL